MGQYAYWMRLGAEHVTHAKYQLMHYGPDQIIISACAVGLARIGCVMSKNGGQIPLAKDVGIPAECVPYEERIIPKEKRNYQFDFAPATLRNNTISINDNQHMSIWAIADWVELVEKEWEKEDAAK